MKSAYTIRPVIDSDLPSITAIYNEAVVAGGSTADIEPRTLEQRAQWVDAHSPREKFPVVVLETPEGTIAGFASLSRFHTRPGYDGIAEVSYYIGTQWRGQGYGKALLEWLIDAAKQKEYRKLTAIIFAQNQGSIALMNRYGFTQYGLLPEATRNDKIGRVDDVSYWYKDL